MQESPVVKTQHSILSPSSAHRWTRCTPSARLEALFGCTTDAYADEGTAAHEQAASILKHLKITKPIGAVTWDPFDPKEIISGTPIMDGVMTYVSYVHILESEAAPGASSYIELPVSIEEISKECWGTLDYLLIDDKYLTIVDLKYGMTPVSAEKNEQLRLYSLGAHIKYKDVYEYDKIRMVISQPRLHTVSEEIISVNELIDWGKSIQKSAKMAFEGKGDIIPGDHCTYCKAGGMCKARNGKYLEVLTKYDVINRSPLVMEELSCILDMSKAIESWLKAVYVTALSYAEKGHVIKGYKIVEGITRRKIVPDKERECIDGLTSAGYPVVDTVEVRLKSLTELKKVLGKEFEVLVEPFLFKPQGGNTLVPLTDKRKEKEFRDDFTSEDIEKNKQEVSGG